MSLVSISEYKKALSIDPSDGNADAEITTYQSEIEGWVKSYLGRDLESATYTEIYDGNGTRELILNQYPITSVTTIEFYDGITNGVEDWDEQEALVDYDRLVIKKTHTVHLDSLAFPYGDQNVRMTYVAGYSETTMPQEIKKACKELMYLYYNEMKQAQSLGIGTNTTGAGATLTITYDKQEVQKILTQLNLHRNLNI